jgi:pimeloyl-ACP methyl ester carboxylesterase
MDPDKGVTMNDTGEQMHFINGAEICVQAFGIPTDPAVLLVHGASASMLGWEDPLCRQIAETGRYVIRYDNRDTGRSTSYPPGQPGYSLSTMADDAIGVLDALGIDTAHLIGRSMAGAIIICAALTHADRVKTLTLVGTSPGDADLPPMTDEFLSSVSNTPDYGDKDSVVDYIVGVLWAYAGNSTQFDESGIRAIVELDVDRTRNIESTMTNHFLIDFDMPNGLGIADLNVPTLIVHGDCDPVFPIEHAHAMQAAIAGSELIVLDDVAHELPARSWPQFVTRLARHTRANVTTEP